MESWLGRADSGCFIIVASTLAWVLLRRGRGRVVIEWLLRIGRGEGGDRMGVAP